jgi:Carbohydrate family 9 binding domain-like
MTNLNQIIEARHTATDLLLSDFQNPEWSKAQPVRIDHYWSGEAAPRGRQCEARLLWSDKALHVRFVGRQEEPLIVSGTPQLEKKTTGLWNRDVCEIFIAPDPQIVERYFEFEASPNGEWVDVAIRLTAEKRESDWEFQSHMTTAARIEKSRITIGMRIPWNQWIHEPQRGQRWRVNLFRCVGVDPGRGYLAWQPTHTKEPAFHVPKAFGWLEFK